MPGLSDTADETDWTHFPHDADVGVCGRGDTLAEAFENAARAMAAVVVPPDEVAPEITVSITCEAPDPEILLVDWLNALIYEMAARNMVFAGFTVEIAGERLRAECRGETVDPARHCPAVELKGATMTDLRVERDPDGRWLARCVVDV